MSNSNYMYNMIPSYVPKGSMEGVPVIKSIDEDIKKYQDPVVLMELDSIEKQVDDLIEEVELRIEKSKRLLDSLDKCAKNGR